MFHYQRFRGILKFTFATATRWCTLLAIYHSLQTWDMAPAILANFHSLIQNNSLLYLLNLCRSSTVYFLQPLHLSSATGTRYFHELFHLVLLREFIYNCIHNVASFAYLFNIINNADYNFIFRNGSHSNVYLFMYYFYCLELYIYIILYRPYIFFLLVNYLVFLCEAL